MLKNKLSRRTFLSLAGAAGVGAGVAAKTALGITDGFLEDLGEGTVADEVVPTVCEICFWKCGILAHKKDGRVFKITGNPSHPLSRGRLCPRGAGGPGLLYDNDRLKKPLIRVGERGDEKFREATWEEALDRVAEGFQKVADEHGPEAVGMLYHGAGASFFKTLLHGFGTPNIAAPSYAQCRGPREVGFELTFGEGAGSPLASGLRDATLTEKPYPIKAWMGYGCNLPNVLPNTQKTLDAIQKLDFMVAIDVLPAEVCGWADVVLPECTYLERHDDLIAPWYREPFAALRQPVVDPLGESKPGWWMAKPLARRLGLEQFFPWGTPREMIHERLKASGYNAAQIADVEQRGVILGEPEPLYLPTGYEYGPPSGKIEFFSQQPADAGFDPLPTYRRPEMPRAGSFRLLTGRAPSHTFGRTANNTLLLDSYPENGLWVNRVIAADFGLRHGGYAMVLGEGDTKTGPIRVKVTERIRADCVYMVHGFGHSARGLSKAHGRGANDSAVITKYETDPLMGGTGFNVNFVRIEPAPDASLGGVEA